MEITTYDDCLKAAKKIGVNSEEIALAHGIIIPGYENIMNMLVLAKQNNNSRLVNDAFDIASTLSISALKNDALKLLVALS
jgi:hypothetical protein